MVVGWLTADGTAPSMVEYGETSGALDLSASGTNATYTYGSYTIGLIHHATMTGLKPQTTYYYRVGDADTGYSEEFSFKQPGVGPDLFPFVIGSIGDLGERIACEVSIVVLPRPRAPHACNPRPCPNAVLLPGSNNNANTTVTHLLGYPEVDAYFFNGDLSYANGCEANGCQTWNAFQRMMQPVTAFKPMHINVGNHEQIDYANGITAISALYRYAGMPYPVGSPDGANYFSYNVGPAHVINLCSFFEGGYGSSSRQTVWLQNDLAAIDYDVTPWVLVTVSSVVWDVEGRRMCDTRELGPIHMQHYPRANNLVWRLVPTQRSSCPPTPTPAVHRSTRRGTTATRSTRARARRCASRMSPSSSPPA